MKFISALILTLLSFVSVAQDLNDLLPIRGLSIKTPQRDGLDQFINFINNDLSTKQINTLVLRVDYNYRYLSHPELQNANPLTKDDVKRIVAAARKQQIQLIPQINLLGHQSWAGSVGNLLKVYPDFDETPHVSMPDKYVWPNEDGLYCKSYCPLHPEVHSVVFALVDEIMEVFESDAFHAGLDEVFYIADDKCPRCMGKAKIELFAGEVKKIRDHLASNNQKLWIWGDRLLDGKSTGLGMWEASENDTHQAIDLIPKDVVICDWHYKRAEPIPPYFAMNGLDVISCTWNNAEVGLRQIDQMLIYQKDSNVQLAGRMKGVMQTVWRSAESFLDLYYNEEKRAGANAGDVESFIAMTKYLGELSGKE